MIKRAPSRTQRTKGIKVKNVLQLCLLLGVCFWLIYQVKHSHDKKKEFDDKDVKVSVKAHSDDEILKLGRKDLPQVQAAAKNERHEDEEEDAVEDENKPEEEEKKVREREERDAVEGHEEANKHDEEEHEDGENKHEDEEQEEEENKNEEEPEEAGRKREEEEQEEESKNEETEDERRGGGDDELDEQDQERTEGEADREDEFIDEEKERVGEGDDDRESEVSEGEDKSDQVENENSLDDHDHEGVDRNTHVSREEHYTADDASSAVSHDNQIIISMTEKANSENSNENFERNVLEEENKSNTTDEISGNQKNMELKLGEGEMAESGSTLNATTAEEKDHGAGSYNSQEHPPLTANNTSTEEGAKTRNNSTGLGTELTGSSLQNGTETKLDAIPTPPLIVALDGATNVEATDLQTTRLEQTNNSDVAFNGNQFDSNTNISTKTVDADAGTGDSFNNSSPALSETFIKLNTTAADGEVSSGSSEMNKTADTTQNETSNSNSESGGTIESSDSSTTTTVGTVDANSNSESGETNENSDSSSMNEIVEAAKEDLIDSSDSSVLQDEKESRIYLGTLPDITAEVDNREEAAAE